MGVWPSCIFFCMGPMAPMFPTHMYLLNFKVLYAKPKLVFIVLSPHLANRVPLLVREVVLLGFLVHFVPTS